MASECFADAPAQLQQAETYMKDRSYEQAEAIYQQIVTDFPDSNDALEAQKQLTILYIKQDNQPQADAALQKLLADFYMHKDIAKAVNKVADHYRWSGKYELARRFYQYVVDNWPDADYAMWSQKSLAASNIRLGDDPNAAAAIEKLLTNFSEHKQIARAVYNVAREYGMLKRYEKACELYQYVIDHWPDDEYAIWSEMEMAEINILSLIKSGDDPNAAAAIEKLLTNFSEHKQIARAVNNIADHYRWSRQYEEARQLYRYVLDCWPAFKHAVWSQARLAMSYIGLGDDPNAAAAIEKLLTNFSEHKQIAKAVNKVADHYRWSRQYEEARQLYRYVLDRWPASKYAVESQALLARSYIGMGDDPSAQVAIDTLIFDFNDHPDLPDAIFQIAEEYYSEAFRNQNEGRYEQAKDYFGKAIIVFERIITEFPASTITQHAYHLLADCYHWFGDKYCGAYVVWHTLYHYGLAKPMDVIVKEMQIERKGSISIYEIVQALKTSGISAHAVKLDPEKISTIDRPFIQYIAPIKGEQLGHFVLCIPTGSGKAVMLDGAEEPKVFELSSFEADDNLQTRWDGTSILIDGISKGTSDAPVSQLLGFNDLLQIAANWLETGYDAWAGADLTGESHLSLDIQLFLRGGCPDDCKNVGPNCRTNPTCTSSDDCPVAEYYCDDKTDEEECKIPGSLPDCEYDTPRDCSPKRMLTGLCEDTLWRSAYYCGVCPPTYGDCGITITQCHN